MEKQYRNELDQISLSERDKQALAHSLTAHKKRSAAPQPRRPLRVAAVAAAAVCALALSAGALVIHTPVIENYFGASAGYQQSAITVGESITRNGWTLTMTDCVVDDYNLYIGFELTAPEGTALDWEGGYYFAQWDLPGFADLEAVGGGYYTQVEDEDPGDNILRFILWCNYIMDDGMHLDGQPRQMEMTWGGLYHNVVWNEDERAWEREYDCEETWTFQSVLNYPNNMIRLEPNLPVTTLDVEATITKVEVSPIGVYVTIEGDALKGHHSWVPKNAPDGWYGCIEYQEVTLYTAGGEAYPLTEGLAGSGCGGGTNTSEDGWLHLARRPGTLLDLDTLESISICGVEIPLR